MARKGKNSRENPFDVIMILFSFVGAIITLIGTLFTKNSRKKIQYPKPLNHSSHEPGVIRIKSFTEDEKYNVDIFRISCTCPDFSDRRSQFSIDDPRRLCKHLIHVLLKEGELPQSLNKYCEKIQGIDDRRKGFPLTKQLAKPVINGHECEIWLCDSSNISDPKYAWCDVYIEKKRFSYSIAEKRWSYNEKPDDNIEIVRYIHKELQLAEPEIKYTIRKQGNIR